MKEEQITGKKMKEEQRKKKKDNHILVQQDFRSIEGKGFLH